jgi:hypothetical protein
MKKLVTILAAAAAASCGSNSGARVRASLTDAPLNIANVAHVNITVSEVRVHSDTDENENENEGEDDERRDGGAGDAGTADAGASDAGVQDGGSGDRGHHEADNDGARGKGWVVLCSTPETFDLMTLRNGNFAPLCAGKLTTLTPGHVSKIWLGVTAAQLVFLDGTTKDLTVPRGHGNGLVIDVDDTLEKDKDGELKIDFVASDSIDDNGDGTFSFHPRLKEVRGH